MGDDKMKNAIKSNMFWICMSGIIVGRIASRILTNYFGLKGHDIVANVALGIVFCSIIWLLITRQYLWALVCVLMSAPIIIAGIGMDLDNTYIIIIGILSGVVIYPILMKIFLRLKKG
ncbi:hypothetical protein [Clostridium sp. KNHs214]|uniref:hypothetical protein n=1 Tax=Clostridium sp. KNHs214 TaxID=1540257 RepID=UPI001639B408|nr:hypothetical protein [Clostridium sp. KNHs214]